MAIMHPILGTSTAVQSVMRKRILKALKPLSLIAFFAVGIVIMVVGLETVESNGTVALTFSLSGATLLTIAFLWVFKLLDRSE